MCLIVLGTELLSVDIIYLTLFILDCQGTYPGVTMVMVVALVIDSSFSLTDDLVTTKR